MERRRGARRLAGTGALIAALALAVVLGGAGFAPSAPAVERAWADEPATGAAAETGADPAEGAEAPGPVEVSADGDAARMEGCDFAVAGFYRTQVGSNRAIDGAYRGYAYLLDAPDQVTAVNTGGYVVVYVPRATAERFGIDLADPADQAVLRAFLVPLDDGQAAGNMRLSQREEWYFTDEPVLEVDGAVFSFDQELKPGRFYVTIAGPEGQDVSEAVDPGNLDACELVAAHEAIISQAGGPLDELRAFLGALDWSPLWITLKTSGTAILIVFVLGLAAAYFTMRISSRAQDIFDTIFTIPMVLPPTVCGFLLLMLLGRNTALGQFFIDVGFPLVFSWQATVIAAVVVAFPLMYRSARGAFENLDPNMLDAARTLGWSNARIFFRLMLPLAWSSIAAGTVLAFARALGEFGCTLFLAGNQLGSTRTIPIAIYFEWMNGNQAATWFWTITLIVFSFVVILFINLWSRHTTKYRRVPRADGKSPKPRRNGRRPGAGEAAAVALAATGGEGGAR